MLRGVKFEIAVDDGFDLVSFVFGPRRGSGGVPGLRSGQNIANISEATYLIGTSASDYERLPTTDHKSFAKKCQRQAAA